MAKVLMADWLNTHRRLQTKSRAAASRAAGYLRLAVAARQELRNSANLDDAGWLQKCHHLQAEFARLMSQ